MGRRSRVEKEDKIVMRIYKHQVRSISLVRRYAYLVGQRPDPGEFVRHTVDLYIHNNEKIKTKTKSRRAQGCERGDQVLLYSKR
jgi:hypothetical protein